MLKELKLLKIRAHPYIEQAAMTVLNADPSRPEVQ